jgi:thiol-disulfide isomerase/thioredoxin
MMKRVFSSALWLVLCFLVAEAQSPPAPQKPPAKAAEKTAKDEASKPPDPEAELHRAFERAGNDQAARVQNLEDYLKRFPAAPRKTAIYRALVEACVQLNDLRKALDYAERIIAVAPDDSAMMLFAVDLLEKAGDPQGLAKAVGYVSRVLDRLEKTPNEGKPPRVSVEDWELERKKLLMSVYLIRGRLEMRQKSYDAARADLEASFRILPNTPAALRLGEIAELRKEYEKAIEHYSNAFAMGESFAESGDRREARLKLGNVWRLLHGSDAGLGQQVLATFDRIAAEEARQKSPERNAGVNDVYALVLRRLTGAPLNMVELKGKVVVLNFWATWCRPCREQEPFLEAAAEKYAGRSDIAFVAVNQDEDETLAAPYVEREKLRGTLVFADGLERILQVRSLPTVIVLDRAGKIIYRTEGFLPEGFIEGLTAAIDRGLAPGSPAIN